MFPGTNLPLNIFEERYIDMVDYSLSKNRNLGMIQHKSNNELYNVGCYGRITVFNETPNKRYFINLEGKGFFKINKERSSNPPDLYMADMTLYAKDEFDKNVAKFLYKNAFPVSLGQINYNYRTEGEIETTFEFAFSQLLVELL